MKAQTSIPGPVTEKDVQHDKIYLQTKRIGAQKPYQVVFIAIVSAFC